MEQTVIPDTIEKNELWHRDNNRRGRTIFFWIHRDAPEAVKEALRLLTYTGIVNKLDSGVVATRREIGTRYSINVGCLAAPAANPIRFITDLRSSLSIKRFTEYGANLGPFTELAATVGAGVEKNSTNIIARLLQKSVTVLDLTDYQKSALQSIEINTVGEILSSTEQVFQRAPYIGPKRSRKIMNVATAAVLEYLSG